MATFSFAVVGLNMICSYHKNTYLLTNMLLWYHGAVLIVLQPELGNRSHLLTIKFKWNREVSKN